MAAGRPQGFEAGRRWLGLADGAIRVLGAEGELRHRWHRAAAVVHQAASRYDQAADHAARAVSGARAVLGDDHPAVAGYWTMLGSVLLRQGRNEEALDKLLAAERIRRRALGDGHPLVGETNQALGRIYLELGRFAEAEDRLQRSLEPLVQVYGEDSAQAVNVGHDLGWIDLQLGRYEQALTRHRALLEIRRRLGDPYQVARGLNVVGLALARLGRHDEAGEALEDAISLAETVRGPEDPAIAYYLINLGELAIRTGRLAEAVSHLRRARGLNASASVQGEVELRLGRIYLEKGALTGARCHLEQGVDLRGPGAPLECADARFALARTLWRSGEDRGGALRLAREAHQGYQKLAAAGRRPGSAVESWLAERELPVRAARAAQEEG